MTLQWTNPTSSGFNGVIIRRATGTTAPSSPTDGTAVASTSASTTKITNASLNPATTYSYALFAHTTSDAYAPRVVITGKTNAPLTIATAVLRMARSD